MKVSERIFQESVTELLENVYEECRGFQGNHKYIFLLLIFSNSFLTRLYETEGFITTTFDEFLKGVTSSFHDQNQDSNPWLMIERL